MKMIQKIAISLAITGLVYQSDMSAAASQESPFFSTIGELKRAAGVYPIGKSAEKEFLSGLQQALRDQAKVIQLNRLKEIFDMELDNRRKKADMMRAQSRFFLEFRGDVAMFEINDPETVALMLRYRSIFMADEPSEFDAVKYAIIKAIVAAYKDSPNAAVKEVLTIQDYYWDSVILDHYRNKHIIDPLGAAVGRFYGFKQHPIFSNLCNHERNPLYFLHQSYACLAKWSIAQEARKAAGIFSKYVDAADIGYFKDCKAIAESYTAAAEMIEKLQKSVERELERFAPKTAPSSSTSFIAALPAVRAQQTMKRSHPGKRKKNAQRSTAAPVRKSPAASSSIDAPVTPKADVPVPVQEDVTPDAILAGIANSAAISVPVKKIYEPITYADGSYTIAEDDTCVEIYDAVNKQKITLFKVENPQQEYSKPCYTEWVMYWFTNPEEALARQGYNDVTSHRFKYRATARPVHGFTPLVDQFLPQCSTVTDIYNWKNKRKDISVTIPGMLGNKLGLFHYIIDRTTGEWYHRNFEERSGKGLVQEYARKGYYDVEFPELK